MAASTVHVDKLINNLRYMTDKDRPSHASVMENIRGLRISVESMQKQLDLLKHSIKHTKRMKCKTCNKRITENCCYDNVMCRDCSFTLYYVCDGCDCQICDDCKYVDDNGGYVCEKCIL